eukprot:CAMPEP_0175137784 /NCGR_PEP_ID=MMETSP0087-20121206/9996_1 /TAXON_ID=136419 /ORGANISM="Unknown Unknown, Strain D1" /LENGTH=823 /DNA_ID=CAMNT_0016420635 /DNA_START=109 /DNA_END=2580 /DNA_ORIENTATION=-
MTVIATVLHKIEERVSVDRKGKKYLPHEHMLELLVDKDVTLLPEDQKYLLNSWDIRKFLDSNKRVGYGVLIAYMVKFAKFGACFVNLDDMVSATFLLNKLNRENSIPPPAKSILVQENQRQEILTHLRKQNMKSVVSDKMADMLATTTRGADRCLFMLKEIEGAKISYQDKHALGALLRAFLDGIAEPVDISASVELNLDQEAAREQYIEWAELQSFMKVRRPAVSRLIRRVKESIEDLEGPKGLRLKSDIESVITEFKKKLEAMPKTDLYKGRRVRIESLIEEWKHKEVELLRETKRNFSKMEEELISERNDLKKQLQNIKTTIIREKEVVSATADFIKTAKEEVLIKLELASRHTETNHEQLRVSKEVTAAAEKNTMEKKSWIEKSNNQSRFLIGQAEQQKWNASAGLRLAEKRAEQLSSSATSLRRQLEHAYKNQPLSQERGDDDGSSSEQLRQRLVLKLQSAENSKQKLQTRALAGKLLLSQKKQAADITSVTDILDTIVERAFRQLFGSGLSRPLQGFGRAQPLFSAESSSSTTIAATGNAQFSSFGGNVLHGASSTSEQRRMSVVATEDRIEERDIRSEVGDSNSATTAGEREKGRKGQRGRREKQKEQVLDGPQADFLKILNSYRDAVASALKDTKRKALKQHPIVLKQQEDDEKDKQKEGQTSVSEVPSEFGDIVSNRFVFVRPVLPNSDPQLSPKPTQPQHSPFSMSSDHKHFDFESPSQPSYFQQHPDLQDLEPQPSMSNSLFGPGGADPSLSPGFRPGTSNLGSPGGINVSRWGFAPQMHPFSPQGPVPPGYARRSPMGSTRRQVFLPRSPE